MKKMLALGVLAMALFLTVPVQAQNWNGPGVTSITGSTGSAARGTAASTTVAAISRRPDGVMRTATTTGSGATGTSSRRAGAGINPTGPIINNRRASMTLNP